MNIQKNIIVGIILFNPSLSRLQQNINAIVGSIDSILRKDESELHDISIWQDNNWAAEMIKHIQ